MLQRAGKSPDSGWAVAEIMSLHRSFRHLCLIHQNEHAFMALQENDVRMLDRLMTTEEAADVLNVSYSWLKKAAQRGVVPCTHIGRAVRFSSAHIHAIVETRESAGSPLPRRGSARTHL